MKKNELVTVVNDFIDLPLKNFTPSEMNLLTTFLAKCKNQKSNLVELEFSEIRDIAKYTSRNNKNLITDIANTNNKLQTLKFAIQTESGTLKQLVLFPTFEIDPNGKKLNIKVNEDFMYILNDLEFEYTSYEASIHNSLASKFSKQAFKQLRKFKSTGIWRITQENFRELLDIPEKYRQTDIDNRVLKPIKEELEPYFPDLEIEKTYKSSNRGRPAVSGYVISWSLGKMAPNFEGKIIDVVAEVTPVTEKPKKRAKKTSFLCPYCKEALYLKQINGEGSPEVYLHLDGWKKDAKCKRIFNDISDIRKAETEVEYGSSSFKKSRTGTIGDILKTIVPNEKKEIDRREEIVKAVPGITTKMSHELFLLIDGYHKVENEGGYGMKTGLQKIKKQLAHMEDTLINAGFEKNDLYEYVFRNDAEIIKFRDL